MKRMGWLGLAVVLGGLLFEACGGIVDAGFPDATPQPDASGDVTVDVGVSPDVTPPPIDAGFDGCGLACSDDLHAIVDCNGVVTSTCPPSLGCAHGTCVAPCAAASANASRFGCDYYAVAPDILSGLGLEGGCWAAVVLNTWGTPVKLGVDRAGQTLDPNAFSYVASGNGTSMSYTPITNATVPANTAAVLFLSRTATGNPTCPQGVTVASAADPALHGTNEGDAFHITADAPVLVFDFAPYGSGSGTASATMLYPTHAWGTNYVAIDAYKKSNIDNGQPSLDVVALMNATQVTIKPNVAIVGGGSVSAATSGVSTTYSLDKGQVLQITQPEELTGSPIESNNPIGLFGASSCMNIDPSTGYCDNAHQQIAPIAALGSEYAGVRYRGRDGSDETVPWRLVGVADQTTLTWDPAAPSGAPSTLSAGQVAEFSAPGPFVVRSQDPQHPFFFATYMTGGQPLQMYGDPEFLGVPPTVQWGKGYTFFTQPSFPETNLVFVRKRTSSGLVDVTLDCVGTLTGWQPIGTGGDFEFTRVDLVRHDFQPQGGCDNGMHSAASNAPFGLLVWAWGTPETSVFTQAVSYAFAAANAVPVNTVIYSAK